jgi:hypothetical protein
MSCASPPKNNIAFCFYSFGLPQRVENRREKKRRGGGRGEERRGEERRGEERRGEERRGEERRGEEIDTNSNCFSPF